MDWCEMASSQSADERHARVVIEKVERENELVSTPILFRVSGVSGLRFRDGRSAEMEEPAFNERGNTVIFAFIAIIICAVLLGYNVSNFVSYLEAKEA